MPTVGLAIIARDEQDGLPTLLDSITGAFDHVVLVDTGSTDRTAGIFTDWAHETGQAHVLDTFTWIDNFAAARNHAHSHLQTDWHSWADGDDEIIGAEHLRDIACSLPRNVDGVLFEHVHHGIDAGAIQNGKSSRQQCRLTRGNVPWIDPVHERQVIRGDVIDGPEDVYWLHHRTDWTSSSDRNTRIYKRWAIDDPQTLITHLWGRCTHESKRAGMYEIALRDLLGDLDYQDARDILHAFTDIA